MKLPSFAEKGLVRAYVGEDPEIIETARTLFIMTASLSLVAFLMVFLIRSQGAERYVMAGLFLILGGLSVLTFLGKARSASFLTTVILSVVLSAVPFLNSSVENFYEFYMIGAFNLFAMGLTALVEFRSWQVFFTAGVSAVAVTLDQVLRVGPYLSAAGENMQVDDAIIVIVLGFIVASALNVLVRREKRFLTLSQGAVARADRQLTALRGAMDASSAVFERGSRLTESARLTAGLASETSSLVGQAKESMDALSGNSRRLGEEISQIGDSSARARSSAEAQSSVINETSAAVEQMTASIRNINGVTRDRQGAVKELAKSTEEGREIVAASSKAMGAVESSTGAILDIVKVISAVAAQTNLLAMNAAIEAAHAGDAGRGFAVVADEIRKLSEQTSKSVKAVTDTVKGTIADIRHAASNNEKAVASFATIAGEAELVSGAMREIIDGLDELSKGTDEINRGVSDSVTSTSELRDAVGSLDAQIVKARESLSSLESASNQVERDLSKVGDKISSISAEAERVEEIGLSNAEGLASLTAALGQSNE